MGEIREAIRRLGERTDNQIAQLMLMITGVACKLPNSNPNPNPQPNPEQPLQAAGSSQSLEMAAIPQNNAVGTVCGKESKNCFNRF
ncbi:hypothetical protein RHMOL_Rhmol13G0146700 [Rhododendron molle]|uniref:Uncharacterized protein n=1 Tax=Rhododendron molle TaxID=49168 RepID=A0ACC0L787_RHOML|nr:hypothetical protein RHMOL_Rhmol13G0146700 [Rhododendron molle]